VTVSEPSVAFASFERKWLDANPEQAAVQIFLDPAERPLAAAFGTLIHELEYTAFAVRETQAAAAKLSWWQQELASAAAGHARHPITRELFAGTHMATIDPSSWQTLADGAMRQLDAPSATSFGDLIANVMKFFLPVASIESAVFRIPADETFAVANLYSCSHFLTIAASDSLLPIIPLEMFARHGVTRAAVEQGGPQRTALIRDFVDSLRLAIAQNLPQARHATLARRVRGRNDLALAAKAAIASDPQRYLASRPRRPRIGDVWRAWNEARATRRQP
jgi:hypothetical protein